MKIGPVDLNDEVFIIAEVGNNHEGDFDLAKKLIALAAEAGAHAVKFQTIVPDRLVSPADTARIAQLSKFQFSTQQFEELSETATVEGIQFLSTPFDVESARFLAGLVPAFKIASGDNNFIPLLEVVARIGKPILLSAGMTDLEQITGIRDFIRETWQQEGIEQELAILHCVVSYPAAPEDADLLQIRALRDLGVVPGYSDHTMGIEAPVLAVALGARVIEKHFTIDKNYSDFRDHRIAADPEDLAELVRRVKEAQVLLGTPGKKMLDCEAELEPKVRRSIVAARNLEAGTALAPEDLSWVRPAGGLPPGQEAKLIGKQLRRSLDPGEMIQPEDIR